MKNFIPVVLLLALALWSCAPGAERRKVDEAPPADTLLTAQHLEQIIPSPGEILYAIQDHGLVFQEGLVHPLQAPLEVPLTRSRALLFGVYLTDFSYLLLFERQSEAIQYLYLIQDYAEALGVKAYFDDEFFNQILSSLSSPEAIRSLSIEHSVEFIRQMQRTGNQELMLLVSIGALSEVIYIATRLIDEQHITEQTVALIVDLATIFDSFYTYFAVATAHDDSYGLLAQDLEELHNIFSAMEISKRSVATPRGQGYAITSQVSHGIAGLHVGRLKVYIELLRNRILNQKY